jgi:hypothetical protein
MWDRSSGQVKELELCSLWQLLQLSCFAPVLTILLCFYSTFSAKRDFASLSRMMPLKVMVPISACFGLALPSPGSADKNYNPYGEIVTISGIKDEVGVLASLQKPKKVSKVTCVVQAFALLARNCQPFCGAGNDVVHQPFWSAGRCDMGMACHAMVLLHDLLLPRRLSLLAVMARSIHSWPSQRMTSGRTAA